MKIVMSQPAQVVQPEDFEPGHHYYPRVLNATLHPVVNHFLGLSKERLIKRYCHLNPKISPSQLNNILSYRPRFLAWAGCDLFHVTTANGTRQMVIIETNSCPSGQKSMPPAHELDEQGGYRKVVSDSFAAMASKRQLPKGALAVLYDKNYMESSGYAAALADHFQEQVYLVPFFDQDPNPAADFENGVLKVRAADDTWHPVRAAFRYVTQRPWNRIPIITKTMIYNPIMACLAGGRNKLLAAKAYDFLNADLAGSGLQIHMPETIWDVHQHEIPLWVKKLGGFAVVKVPYSNAGQGVYTITNEEELEEVMKLEAPYDRFIVQSLVGNANWSSRSRRGCLYHVGTVPNKRNQIFVADIQMMVCAGEAGYRPLAIYARRARRPLTDQLEKGVHSWDILGTNLSIRSESGDWETETERLMMMDRKDYNSLGLGIDDIIEAYFQTVLAAMAIDKLAGELITQKGRFRAKLFESLDEDRTLLKEILI